MKKLILILLCLPVIGFSQEQKKIYFDSDWKACAKSKAEYFRLITVNDYGNVIGKVKDYYITGELQWTGQFSSYNTSTNEGVSEGLITWYYKNGNKSAEATYSNDKIIGIRTGWYETGELYSHQEYSDNGKFLNSKYYYKSGPLYSFYIAGEQFFTLCDEYGECEKVFEEKFENNSNDWYLGDDDNMVRKIRDEQLYFYNKDAGLAYKTVLSFPFDVSNDFSIETTILDLDVKKYGAGLIWGAKDWDNYYCFKISANGYYKISAEDKGVKTTFGKKWTESELINTGSASNKLKILKEGDKYLFAINGSVVHSDSFYKIRSSKIGFIFPPGEGAFDNLIIKYKIASNEILDKNNNKTEWSGNGSGFFISETGYIATNYHVIEKASEIEVEFKYRNEIKGFNAKVIQTDARNDLAILKIDDDDFSNVGALPYTFRTRSVDAGTKIYTYGYPKALGVKNMGKEIKVTEGIISSKSAAGGDITKYQIDAAIQHGNSGGPLFDDKGNLIGINSSRFPSEETENVNYAIKSSYLLPLIDGLPETISLPSSTQLASKPLTEQIKILSDYVVLIKVK